VLWLNFCPQRPQIADELGMRRSAEADYLPAEFRVNRSPISRESDHRFHPKAINVFTGKRSRISRDSDHSIGSMKTVIAII
jgi:hypothetical protein